jgi:hypothetical protein
VEPNWKPLEARLGRSRCAGFMFMGRINGINLYKHGITRTYLNLDDDGNCFRPTGGGCYQPADFHDEIHSIDEHLKILGYSLDTSYDSSFIAAKEQTLRRQGMAVVVLQVTPEDIKIN